MIIVFPRSHCAMQIHHLVLLRTILCQYPNIYRFNIFYFELDLVQYILFEVFAVSIGLSFERKFALICHLLYISKVRHVCVCV